MALACPGVALGVALGRGVGWQREAPLVMRGSGSGVWGVVAWGVVAWGVVALAWP